MNTAILILGAHRSGTSALTRMMSFLGYDLPKNLMASLGGNEAGHWESEAVAQMNDRVLEELGQTWEDWHSYRLDKIGSKRKSEIIDDIKRVIESEYIEGGDIVIKDPRICRLTEFVIPALESLPAQVKIIIPYRNPLEVIASLAKRNGFSKGHGALIWLRYVLDAERGSRGYDRVVIEFRDYLSDPQKSISAACKALELKPKVSVTKVKAKLETFVRDDLKHHNFDKDLLLVDPVTRGWVQETVEYLTTLKVNPNDSDALAGLDRISRELEDMTPLMKSMVDGMQQKKRADILQLNDDWQKEYDRVVEEKSTEIKRINADWQKEYDRVVEEKSTEIKRINADWQKEYDRVVEEKSTEIKRINADWQKEYDRLDSELRAETDHLKKDLKAHKSSAEQLQSENNLFAQDVKNLGEVRAALKTEVGRLNAQLKQTQKDYKVLSGEKDALIATRDTLIVDLNTAKEKWDAAQQEHDALLTERNALFEAHAQLSARDQQVTELQEAHDRVVTDLRSRLQTEQRTVIKPFLRNVRRGVGFVLRLALPNAFVDKLAFLVPTAEQKQILQQRHNGNGAPENPPI